MAETIKRDPRLTALSIRSVPDVMNFIRVAMTLCETFKGASGRDKHEAVIEAVKWARASWPGSTWSHVDTALDDMIAVMKTSLVTDLSAAHAVSVAGAVAAANTVARCFCGLPNKRAREENAVRAMESRIDQAVIPRGLPASRTISMRRGGTGTGVGASAAVAQASPMSTAAVPPSPAASDVASTHRPAPASAAASAPASAP